MKRAVRDAVRLAASLAAVVAVTWLYARLHLANAATVSTTFLLVVLVVAATCRLWVAVATSVAAMLSLNFFFLPPLGTLTIADPQNWMALFAFLAVSLVGSNLSAVARARTQEALGRRDELGRLFELSRDVLVMTDSPDAISVLARAVALRFELDFVAIALPRAGEWDVFEGGARSMALDRSHLARAFAAAQSVDAGAVSREYAGHPAVNVDDQEIRLVPLRVGMRPIGILAATGRPIEPGTLDTLGSLAAMAIERAHFLEERKAAALTRQSEALKTALLASLGHDLRTPLTAIRVAASNVTASWMTDDARAEQSDIILAEVEHLTRLFENVLAMARIDSGAIPTETRWVHPSEIIAAARELVSHTLRQHAVEQRISPDVPVRIDPRLTAMAVGYLLENAAQYSPSGTTIEVVAGATADGLRIDVRDHGPGIAPADLPHVFDRFYRGNAGKGRTSGTGMGLWIARGVLGAAGGQMHAENCADGGSRFFIRVPAPVKQPEPLASALE